jgi:hypothetical protein
MSALGHSLYRRSTTLPSSRQHPFGPGDAFRSPRLNARGASRVAFGQRAPGPRLRRSQLRHFPSARRPGTACPAAAAARFASSPRSIGRCAWPWPEYGRRPRLAPAAQRTWRRPPITKTAMYSSRPAPKTHIQFWHGAPNKSQLPTSQSIMVCRSAPGGAIPPCVSLQAATGRCRKMQVKYAWPRKKPYNLAPQRG